ncbi:stage V sporulation protein B [Gorillibacterium sp. sgz5001074]|uniref:stage V sporulation protein B n=1 Tax=Gorillibacterium sp. sgz5001074 TaxID=3446695 RepID=UPI003F6669C3
MTTRKPTNRKTKQTFIGGALILVAAGIINRILGFVPRILLPRIIGAEGVGLYQLGYPFLIVVLTVITGGIPLAVAKLVAEAETEGNEARVRKVLKVSLLLSVSLGILFTALCYLAASWITSHLLTDDRVHTTFLVMSPIILLVSVSAVYRGYFQGRQNMIPTALSQITETVIRIAAVLVFSWLMLPYGLEYAAAGAMFGVLTGEFGGMAVMLIMYAWTRKDYLMYEKAKIGKDPHHMGGMSALKRIIKISVPVTISKLVGSFSYLFESIMIAQSLALAGVATAVATAQYGALQGMVIPVLLLPSALTFSLSVSLVPSLSEAAARGDNRTIHKRLHQSLRLALVTGAPFAVIMYVLAEPLCYYLYGHQEISVMLKMMAPIALFIYFQAPLQATLQALDKPGTALINTTVGAIVKLVLIYVLASNPRMGILGAVMAININTMLVTILHYASVSRMLRFAMKAADFYKTGLAMAMMGAVCYLGMSMEWTPSPLIRFLASMAAGIALYLAATVWLKLIDGSDLRRIPGFRKT